ncbi:hypothetical protein C9J85_05275 [Haloferax sp. wsp5]|nr:hypothetical protein C9J85_05275 [Haloferax sp. wsp5]
MSARTLRSRGFDHCFEICHPVLRNAVLLAPLEEFPPMFRIVIQSFAFAVEDSTAVYATLLSVVVLVS